MMRPYRPYHRSRREPAPVQRRRPSPRTTEMIPCTSRLLCSYTTHSVHSHLSTPHRTREGVQQPNLTVSSKHIIKLITLTFFSLRAHRTRTLASRLQPTGTRVRMRQHLSLSPSHSLTSPTQTLRNAIDDNSALATGPDADARRRGDAALQRERHYSSARGHTLNRPIAQTPTTR